MQCRLPKVTRQSYISVSRRDQSNRSAMERYHSGGNAFRITGTSMPGKVAQVKSYSPYN